MNKLLFNQCWTFGLYFGMDWAWTRLKHLHFKFTTVACRACKTGHTLALLVHMWKCLLVCFILYFQDLKKKNVEKQSFNLPFFPPHFQAISFNFSIASSLATINLFFPVIYDTKMMNCITSLPLVNPNS